MKIKRILIANRSEISLRVIRTCRHMGIETVSIYAHDDKNLKHVKEASISVDLGAGPLSETYLNQEKIIGIAKEKKCDAIHPGYGFLSENAAFCENVEKAGLIFIGPCSETISLMGDKRESKLTVEKIGGPLIPGFHGEIQDEESLKKEAEKIGAPVLIKASAGGGGKGMRVVKDLKDFKEELQSAKREAMNAFGNDLVLIEKYIENPRHIEVQVLSDTHGNHLHFYERECSIQRRHQKIVEETPSVALDEKLRKDICHSAVSLAKSINYRGAGTVEYILDQSGQFYFLEMNTRLQVEHPITELATGIDLVEWQIRIAQGEKISMKQPDISQRGHAIEVRVYAEDPEKDFMPTGGVIGKIGKPLLQGVRVECAYEDGQAVTTSYDPMVAKLVVHGQNREGAILKMLQLINEVPFLGLESNLEYIRKILQHRSFQEGETFTNFVETYRDDLIEKELDQEKAAWAIAAYHLIKDDVSKVNGSSEIRESLFQVLGSFRN